MTRLIMKLVTLSPPTFETLYEVMFRLWNLYQSKDNLNRLLRIYYKVGIST